MQIRYSQLVSWLLADFPDIKPQHIGQYVSRWKKTLGVEQSRKGWYDMEDYQGLKALGIAYRDLGFRGCEAKTEAREYAATQIENWRRTNGNQY